MKHRKDWIKIVLIMILCHIGISTTSAFAVEPTKRGIVKGAVEVKIPEWFKLSFLDFREETQEAAENNKHVIIFFHMDGCPYCSKMLKDNFVHSKYQKFIRDNFEAIEINVDGSREVVFNDKLSVTEKQLAEVQGVALTPAILFMNADNQMVMRIDGYRSPAEFRTVLNYVHEKAYYKLHFADYRSQQTKRNVYALVNEPYFTKTNNLRKLRKKGKTIAVLFEDKTCSDCERFHKKVLNLPETRKIIKKLHFVRLDALSTKKMVDINGNKTTPKKWVDSLGITYRPAVILFTPEGKEIDRIAGFARAFHFQSLLGYSVENRYKKYASWTDYMGKRQERILQAGKNVDISE